MCFKEREVEVWNGYASDPPTEATKFLRMRLDGYQKPGMQVIEVINEFLVEDRLPPLKLNAIDEQYKKALMYAFLIGEEEALDV